MYIIIVGAGGIGKKLVQLALKDKNNVIVVEKEQEKCEELARKQDVIIINADATKEETLKEAEIKKADALIATTEDDSINLMIVSLAKNMNVPMLISVVNKEEAKPMFEEKKVNIVKNPDDLMAEYLYKSLKHPTVDDFMHVGENAEMFTLPLSMKSKFSGKSIKKIKLPKKCLIVAIEREKEFIIPTNEVEIYPGDKITILAPSKQVDKVAKLLAGN